MTLLRGIKNIGMTKPYKITEITEEHIKFSNGFEITYDHCPDWCEWNYAQFDALDDIAKEATFVGNLDFEQVPGYGFKFGNKQDLEAIRAEIPKGYLQDFEAGFNM